MQRPTEKAHWQRKAPHTCVSPHCSFSRSWAPSTHIQLGLAGSTPQEGPLNAGASGGGWLSILSPGCGCPAVLRSPPRSRLPHPSPSGSTPHCPDPGRGLWYWPRGCRGEATQTAYPPVSPYLLKIPTTPAPDPHSPAQTHCFQTLGPHPRWGPLSSPRCGDPPGGWQVGTVSGSPPPQLQARGFRQLHGVDGSPGMLDQAQARGLYQCLSLCTLGREPLPSAEGTSPPTLTAQGPPSDRAPCFGPDAIPLA